MGILKMLKYVKKSIFKVNCEMRITLIPQGFHRLFPISQFLQQNMLFYSFLID